jgi:hypothetical protein
MKTKPIKTVRPDAKGRIALGLLAQGVSSFAILQDEDNRIILIPYTEIPANEKWLFNNKEALGKVKKGLQESATGKVRSLGSFKRYLGKKIK